MHRQRYQKLLNQYWQEIIMARNWHPDREKELGREMSNLVKTEEDEQQAMLMQMQLYEKKIA